MSSSEIGILEDVDIHQPRAVLDEVEDKTREKAAVEIADIDLEAGKAIGDGIFRPRDDGIAGNQIGRLRGQIARKDLVVACARRSPASGWRVVAAAARRARLPELPLSWPCVSLFSSSPRHGFPHSTARLWAWVLGDSADYDRAPARRRRVSRPAGLFRHSINCISSSYCRWVIDSGFWSESRMYGGMRMS